MSRRLAALAAVLLPAAVWPAPAAATALVERTFLASFGSGGAANGASTRPALSAGGGLVAFDSVATDLAPDANGTVRDVFARGSDGATRLVSRAPGGGPADGPSSAPAIGGPTIAFQSDATNLVAGDANGAADVFAEVSGRGIVLVSAGREGSADGPSGSPDVSQDGARVVFVSSASNLVARDDNGVADVFVRDLRTRTTRLVSRPPGGGRANAASAAPAISPDGRYVVFSSRADNLVAGDTNGVQDVFLADLRTGRLRRVSISTRGTQQNRAVVEPFDQVADVSRGGRFVVFDSDATNLVPGDRNRDTDVFVRNMKLRRTLRVSLDKFGFEADNDSIHPTLSPDGTVVAFQSFAERLAPRDARGPDVFLYDLRRFAPTVVSVPARGGRRRSERVAQLLQRPALSTGGRVVAFTSTAGNLVRGDSNGAEDVFLRVTAPPRARIRRGPRGTVRSRRPRLHLRADDRRVRDFICTLDRVRVRCGRRGRLPRLARGRHELRVFAGGPGMLFQPQPLIRRFRVR